MLRLVRRSPALVAALAVLLVAGSALSVTHHAPTVPIPKQLAVRDSMRDIPTRVMLRRLHWDSVTTSRVDSGLERVSFYSHGQIVAAVALTNKGLVAQALNYQARAVPYGSTVAYEPAVLIGLSLLFVLMAGVAPLRRLRNADVLAVLSMLAPVLLLQHRYVNASVISALPGLCYLIVRCLLLGLGSRAESPQSTPLFDYITSGWEAAQRVRVLRIVLVAVAVAFAMVGLSSTGAVDVIYGVMEGATKLIHGVLPYGHMPGDVIHGDTYPLLSYAVFAPLAWLSPVNNTWDSVDIALGFTVAAALVAAAVLWRTAAGPRRGAGMRRPPEAEVSGLRAALTLLSFPTLMITVSTGTTDVVLAVMLALAVVLWRRPVAATAALAIGGWFKLAPFVLLPLLVGPLRGRRLLASLATFGAVSAAVIVALVAIGGVHGPSEMLHALAFQFSRGSPNSIWTALGIDGIQPVGQAAVLALIAAAAVRLGTDPELAADRTRVAALAAAILIALQLAAYYWSFLYLVWMMPLVGMSLLVDPAPATALAPVASRARRVRHLAPGPA